MIQGNRTQPVKPAPTIRWRWYHFYFLLALFDIIVISGTLAVYHRTLVSYEQALHRITNIHTRQRWLTELRLTVVKLNAPGNDVFRSKQVEAERKRFERTHSELSLLMQHAREYREDLSEFRSHLDRMVKQEREIFALFLARQQENVSDRQALQTLEKATEAMAVMDHYQANALNALSELRQVLSMREAALVQEYGQRLRKSELFERSFLGMVVLILLGVFWYGRKLQRMHETMMTNQHEADVERHKRLAAVGEVCSAVAHGIRNPLASISSSAQLVVGHGSLDPPTKGRIEDILTECRRLDQRITRLLHFSSVPVQFSERFDLKETIEQAISEIRMKLDERNIHISRDYQSGPLAVQGDSDQIAQSIIEILSNSMDYLPNGGHVHIACRQTMNLQHHADIDIIDDGPGIPQQVQSRVFDMFYTTKDQGIGIGLASVKRTVELHGGRASVLSDGGKGTHIRISLPLAST